MEGVTPSSAEDTVEKDPGYMPLIWLYAANGRRKTYFVLTLPILFVYHSQDTALTK
jgi:hypothetical protein